MDPRRYDTRCQVCGSCDVVIIRKQTTLVTLSKEYKIKRCGLPSGKGTIIDKTVEDASYWLIKCCKCNWSQLTSGPDE